MTHVADVKILASKVDADLTDFSVLVDLSDLKPTFWSTVANGGGDIRVYKSDGTTELAREVVSCDTTAETGELWVRYDGTLSSSVDTTIQIHADGTSSDYAVTATYGRNNVWQDYHYVGHLEADGTDSTGNNTVTNNGSPSDATGQIGKGKSGDSSNSYFIPATYTPPFTLQAWSTTLGSGSRDNRAVALGDASETGTQLHIGVDNKSGYKNTFLAEGTATIKGPAATSGVSTFVVGVAAATDLRELFVDGVSSGTSTATYSPSGIDRAAIGSSADSTPFSQLHEFDEARIRYEILSSDWITTEYNNQSSPSTFYTVTEIGAGGTTVEASAVSATNITATSITPNVTLTNAAAGTLYWAVYPSTQGDPSDTDIIAGTVTNGIHANEASPTTDGAFAGSTISGLTAGTSYKLAAVWDGGTDTSAVAVSGAFDTLNITVTSAALQAQPAQMSGEATREIVTTTAALQAAPATLSGTGARVITATGALQAGSAGVTADLGANANFTVDSAALQAQPASLTGTVTRTVTASGSLQAAPAVVTAGTTREIVVQSAALAAGPSRVTAVTAINGEVATSGSVKSTSISTGKPWYGG